jgi:hypothetical protein
MGTMQVLAALALVSMSVPAALAVLFWRERNAAMTEVNYLNNLMDSKEESADYWYDRWLKLSRLRGEPEDLYLDYSYDDYQL